MRIAEAFKAVQERINNSAVKVGRNSDNIQLVAVTKTIELQRIIEAVNTGVLILGENRVQEARDKITELRIQINPPIPPLLKGGTGGLEVEWHLIGHLQKNKAKYSVQLFDLIHTIDSISLAKEVNNQAEKIEKKQRVLVQVKCSVEETKHGISEENLIELLEKINGMENIKLEGLMTMPPFFENPEKTRPYFSRLRQLADKASEQGFSVNELSMGMSNDFEIAIEEGATMVRIGSAIFGERNADKKTK